MYPLLSPVTKPINGSTNLAVGMYGLSPNVSSPVLARNAITFVCKEMQNA
jgi:hypothetical protein